LARMEKMAATENIETRGNTYYHVETQNVVDSADQRTSHPSPPKLQEGRLLLACATDRGPEGDLSPLPHARRVLIQ
jgi:hypothetical protein